MSNESRGEAIKRRRIALGITTPTEFAAATGKDWETITRAEAGESRSSTYDDLEAWLTREEYEAGMVDEGPAPASGPIRLTLHGIYGVDEIIVEGPVDHPDELAEAVGKILERLSRREDGTQ